MDKLELKALGKINLGLDILGRRENGYHDVRMVMQTVYLYDRVIMEKMREPGIEIRTNLGFLPVNENNIAYKAADLMIREFDIREGNAYYPGKSIFRWRRVWQEEAPTPQRCFLNEPYVFSGTF